MSIWIHIFLAVITGGIYLLLYIPFIILRAIWGRKKTKSKPVGRLRIKSIPGKTTNYDKQMKNYARMDAPVSGYVYLIHAEGTTYYKIGRTNRLERRVRELTRTQGPHPYRMIDSIKVSNSIAAERFLHERYAKWRGNGEWFDLKGKRLDQVRKDMHQIQKKGVWRS